MVSVQVLGYQQLSELILVVSLLNASFWYRPHSSMGLFKFPEVIMTPDNPRGTRVTPSGSFYNLLLHCKDWILSYGFEGSGGGGGGVEAAEGGAWIILLITTTDTFLFPPEAKTRRFPQV